jgi:hypothetical protein
MLRAMYKTGGQAGRTTLTCTLQACNQVTEGHANMHACMQAGRQGCWLSHLHPAHVDFADGCVVNDGVGVVLSDDAPTPATDSSTTRTKYVGDTSHNTEPH